MSRRSWQCVVSLAVVTVLAGGCVPVGLAGASGASGLDGGVSGAEAADGRPTRIAIDHDDYDAKHVGHTADGRQFFLTTPFDPGEYGTDTSREFVALYLFAADGRFLSAQIDALGSRERLDKAEADRVYRARLRGLGRVTFDRIEVEPFAVRRFGLQFGLIAHPPDEDSSIWWVTAEPGDYMAFAAPWDSGIYDT